MNETIIIEDVMSDGRIVIRKGNLREIVSLQRLREIATSQINFPPQIGFATKEVERIFNAVFGGKSAVREPPTKTNKKIENKPKIKFRPKP